jgi:hypothetical protein
VANSNRGRRGRPRKRRPAQKGPAPATPAGSEQKPKRSSPASTPPRAGREAGRSRRRPSAAQRSGRGLSGTLALGDRPHAPWHPLPLSELLILVGAIGTLIGISRGESGIVLIFAGLVAVLIGTIEVTLREHLSGYRSHTLILSLLPTVILYTGLVILTHPPLALNLALLAAAVLVATLLFKVLRARFLDARRERAFGS